MKVLRSLLGICLMAGLLVSCGEEEETYVPSKGNESLPAKTSSGNNIAGALVNGTAWRSTISEGSFMNPYRDLMVFRNQPVDSTTYLEINLYGEMNDKFNEGTRVEFYFMLADSQIQDIQEVTQWRGDSMHFEGKRNYTGINSSLMEDGGCEGGTGWIHFKKIALRNEDNYFMAGTFELTINNRCAQTRVRKGRFDFTLEKLN